jgi:hypothetical protein
MPIAIKAVREKFGFIEGIPPSLREAFAKGALAGASFQGKAAQSEESESIEITLGGRRKSASAAKSAEDQPNKSSSSGGLRGLLGELQNFAAELEELEARAAEAPLGSEQNAAIREELEKQKAAYDEILQSPVFGRLEEIMRHVERMFSQGVSPEAVARALQRERGLLGDELLGAIQGGDLSSLSSIRDMLNGFKGVDVLSGTASPQLKKLTDALFNALEGKTYKEKPYEKPALEKKDDVVAAPALQRLDMDLPGDLSFRLISVTGKDVAKAIESHSLPDPKHALVLVLDTERKTETSLEKKKREQDEEEKRIREKEGREGAVTNLVS